MKIAQSQVNMSSFRMHQTKSTAALQKGNLSFRQTVRDSYEHAEDSGLTGTDLSQAELPKNALAAKDLSANRTVGAQEASSLASTPQEILHETLRLILERLLGWNAEGRGNSGSEDDASVSSQKASSGSASLYRNASLQQTYRVSAASSVSLAGDTLGLLSFVETEYTGFYADGRAVTEDGRVIYFSVDVEMSRSFASIIKAGQISGGRLLDPLMINVGSGVTQISDQKFRFDLDADGTEEEISMPTGGTGFLALDKNGDGKIGDGSELFGAKTGDGFGDLAAYDSDGNGWIDENDEIFSKLRVWYKNAEGEDELLDLKEAGIGAVFLGSASTEFTLNETGTANGIIRRTGFFLKESGAVGTLQHVDLAVSGAGGAQSGETAGKNTDMAAQAAGSGALSGADLQQLLNRLFEPLQVSVKDEEAEEKESALAMITGETEDTGKHAASGKDGSVRKAGSADTERRNRELMRQRKEHLRSQQARLQKRRQMQREEIERYYEKREEQRELIEKEIEERRLYA